MTRPSSCEADIYHAILALDDFHDEQPELWDRLTAEEPAFLPADAAEALSLAEPCGALRHLITDGRFPIPDIAEHPDLLKQFNALAYTFGRAAQERRQCSLPDSPEDLLHLLRYSQTNMQTSYLARLMVGAEQNLGYTSGDLMESLPHLVKDNLLPGITIDTVTQLTNEVATDTGTAKHFNRLLCPTRQSLPDYRNSANHEARKAMHDLLNEERRGMLRSDMADFVPDIQTEAEQSVASPNLMLTWLRCRRPEFDLHGFAENFADHYRGSTFAHASWRNKEPSLCTFPGDAPDWQALDALLETENWLVRELFTSREAKAAFRSAGSPSLDTIQQRLKGERKAETGLSDGL